MFRLLILFFVYFACLCTPIHAPAKEPAPNLFDGKWINDRGSIIVIEQTGERLSGYYQTAIGRPDESETFPLTGWTQGDMISFSVNFKGYGSITAWNGQLSKDESGPYIRTLWHLSRNVDDEDESKDMWSSVIAGASEFRRAKQEKESQ